MALGSEKRLNIPGAADNPDNLYTVLYRYIENDVVAYGKAAESWGPFRPAATQKGIFGKETAAFFDEVYETVCAVGVILGNVEPDFIKVGFRLRMSENFRH